MLELINKYLVESIPNRDAARQRKDGSKYFLSFFKINKVIAIPVDGKENQITYMLSE
ncbi:hypothetical protein ACUYWG_000412 [Escherichia coli]|nr:hypothetical protein [Escherichia coli]